MTAIFHDFPGLENGLPKFHDFPWLGGTLIYTHACTHRQTDIGGGGIKKVNKRREGS